MDSPIEQFLNNILFFAEDTDLPAIDQIKVSSWIQNTIKNEEATYQSINIIFCSDEFLLRLNKEHLSHDYFTDIITFQYEQSPIEGELFISVDRVRENAEDRKLSFENELHRVMIHGVLHMIGYADKSEEDKIVIRSKEDYYLSEIVK